MIRENNSNENSKYEVVIGLEIHLRLATKTKLFCGCENLDSLKPNIYICPICTGQPGVLPVINIEAVSMATRLGLAIHGEVQELTDFSRKNYFYPDLPKGYQISQYEQPLVKGGWLEIYPDDINPVKIRLVRLHLEEDAAKLKHDSRGDTLVDFNRAGTPLVEIVGEPDLHNPLEAKVFLQDLQQLARYLKVSKANMEKGEMRCDANISLRPRGDTALYPKTEIKNMNSFRSVERALSYEIERQQKLWETGQAPEANSTRGWDDRRAITILQRKKEEASDYRYFSEPDLPPLKRSFAEIKELQKNLPELPQARRQRFQQEFGLSFGDAKLVTLEPEIADFFEQTISELKAWLMTEEIESTPEEIWQKFGSKVVRLTLGWLTTEIFRLLNKNQREFANLKITPENFAELLTLLFKKRVNSSAGQKILEKILLHGGDPSVIMEEHDLGQINDEKELGKIITETLNENKGVINDYVAGKEKVLMFLVGQVMKKTKGKVNPEVAGRLLKEQIKKGF